MIQKWRKVLNKKNKKDTDIYKLLDELYSRLEKISDTDEIKKIVKDLYELSQSRYDYMRICDHIYDGIHISDGSGKIIYINPGYTRTTGIKTEEIVGRYIQDIENEGKFYKGSVTVQVLRERKQVNSIAYILRKDKEVLVTGTPLFNDSGEIQLVVCSTRDFSGLKELEQKLKDITIEQKQTYDELAYMRKMQIGERIFQYQSKAMESVIEMVYNVSDTDATVLITGESGTGKELIAGMLYQESKRSGRPFIKVNCAAIPTELLESELFGYENGAFTGAKSGGKAGLLSLANTGVLLLDEIGELPLGLQSKLLRVLQEREVTPLGGQFPIPLDFRLIVSTNRDLEEQVAKGEFRQDLYYRLNVIPINLPPLRERREDIPLLANQFCENLSKKYAKKQTILSEGIELLIDYDWPGNVRELENLIERIVVINTCDKITPNNIYRALYGREHPGNTDALSGKGLKSQVQAFEQNIILNTLKQEGSYRKAAKVLGVDHSTLAKKMSTAIVYDDEKNRK